MSPTTSATPQLEDPAKTAKKTRKRKYKKKANDDTEYTETRKEVDKLRERLGGKKKRGKDDDRAYFTFKNDRVVITSCESHTNIITRALENQVNRCYQIDIRNDTIQTSWRCCLCHLGSAQRELGDLFGPYYMTPSSSPSSSTSPWPTFLCKKPKAENIMDVEVWMHGDCVLWAPDIQLNGNHLTNLNVKLKQFWGQHCAVCSKVGASIPVLGTENVLHFPCAVQKGYKLDEGRLTCEPR
ncbi:unnamed protein product [Caenorhabditis auriculariae]|uniref:PHD-type domain-containing protein n=1 Tax=Caenorhabditis auriculariae TaxID=2777116 RepID=A0A8S1HN12_9PELO|nr:unnamed protein product [Caenorhabditis auriculariae]